MDQPTQALTWAELQTVAFGFVVANASQTQPIAGGTLGAAVAPALALPPVAVLPTSAGPAADAATNASPVGPSQTLSAVDAALAEGQFWRSGSALPAQSLRGSRWLVADASGFDRLAWLHDAAFVAMVGGPSLDDLP
jgi:hypothetical protein